MGPFTWDASVGQYRDARGRFVPRTAVRTAIDEAINRAQVRMMRNAVDLAAGRISVARWRDLMADDLRDVHLYSGAAARGGWGQMTQSDYGRVGQRLRVQYEYLNAFAEQIASGAQKLDGRYFLRVKMYAQSGRSTFHRVDDALQERLGMTEERNVLHPAEHCDGCLEETARGWVPIGDLVPIGERDCLTMDKCTKAFR